MTLTFLRTAITAAALAMGATASASPVMLNFKGTITSHYDFFTGTNVAGNVGGQVDGHVLLDLTPAAPSDVRDASGKHIRGWYSASGCQEYLDGVCVNQPQNDPAYNAFVNAVLGYSINLPEGLATDGSMMSAATFGSSSGLNRTQFDAQHYQYANIYWADHIRRQHGYDNYDDESQMLVIGAWSSSLGLFNNIDAPIASLDFLNASSAYIDFTYMKSACAGGYCRFEPNSIDYQMSLTQWSLEAVQTSVPEPATLPLLGSGIAGLALLRRRKRINAY